MTGKENAARAAPRNSCFICLFIEVRLFRLYFVSAGFSVIGCSACQNTECQEMLRGRGGNWYITRKPCGARGSGVVRHSGESNVTVCEIPRPAEERRVFGMTRVTTVVRGRLRYGSGDRARRAR